MTLFAPLSLDGKRFTALRFDVLVWNLENQIKFQRLIVDTTLVIKSAVGSLNELELLVPFRLLSESDAESIFDKLPDGELTLPGSSSIDRPSKTITYRDELIGTVRARSFEVDSIKLLTPAPHWYRALTHRAEVASTVRLKLDPPLQKDKKALLRARWHIYGPNGIALWKRSGLGLNGARFEVRVFNDPFTSIHAIRALEERFAVVETSSICFVLRSSFQLRAGHPVVRQSLVEGRAFEDYLDRPTDLRSQGSLVSYYSDSTLDPPPTPVPGSSHLFLDVSREFGLMSFGNFVRIAVVVMMVVLVAASAGVIARGPSMGTPDWFAERWRSLSHWEVAGGSGVGAGLFFIITRIKKVRGQLSILRGKLYRLERLIWKRLLGLRKSG